MGGEGPGMSAAVCLITGRRRVSQAFVSAVGAPGSPHAARRRPLAVGRLHGHRSNRGSGREPSAAGSVRRVPATRWRSLHRRRDRQARGPVRGGRASRVTHRRTPSRASRSGPRIPPRVGSNVPTPASCPPRRRRRVPVSRRARRRSGVSNQRRARPQRFGVSPTRPALVRVAVERTPGRHPRLGARTPTRCHRP